MKEKGICSKCGQLKPVVHHHYKGYGCDETKLYCYSCDQKAHYKARKEGKCILSHDEAKQLSQKSSNNDRINKFLSYIRIEDNISLKITMSISTRTGTLNINTRREYRKHASYGEQEF